MDNTEITGNWEEYMVLIAIHLLCCCW